MTRQSTLRLSLLLACIAPAAASAQTAALQYSGIAGQDKVLTISRLPTSSTSGKVEYYDAIINLAVSASGLPSIASSTFMLSPPGNPENFVPGRYYVSVGGCAVEYGDLTSSTGSGGSTLWSLIMETNPSCNGAYPDQASWQTVAPTPNVAARLKAAKVPNNPNYSYGTTDVGGGCYGAFCDSNGLLAAEQVSRDLTLVSYTYNNADQAGEVGRVTYVLCNNPKCTNAPQ